MHPSSFAHMKLCVDAYLSHDRHYDVLDLGSRRVVDTHRTHQNLLKGYDCAYRGADIVPGDNVHIVMNKPYRIPVKANSFDVVMSSQAFEHIPFPWATILEMARVTRPGGLIFVIAPSRGHRHGVTDCWRYYPDSMRALAAWARLDLLERHIDLPPTVADGERLDYGAIDTAHYYWGDAVGVFRKPDQPSKLVRIATELVVTWANRVGSIGHVHPTTSAPGRERVLG